MLPHYFITITMLSENQMDGFMMLAWVILLASLLIYIIIQGGNSPEDQAAHLRECIKDAMEDYYVHMDQLGYSKHDADSLLDKEFGWSTDHKQNLKTLKSLNRKLRKIPRNGHR